MALTPPPAPIPLVDIALSADAAHDLMASVLEKLPSGLDAMALLYGGRTDALHMRGTAVLDQHHHSHATLSLRLARQVKKNWHAAWAKTTALSPSGIQQLMNSALDALPHEKPDPNFIPALEAARFSVLSATPPGLPPLTGPAFHANEVARTVMAAQRYGLVPEVFYTAGFGSPRWMGSDAPNVIANHFGGFAFHSAPASHLDLRLTAPSGWSVTRSAEGTRRAHADGEALITEWISALGPPKKWPTEAASLGTLAPKTLILDRGVVAALMPPLLMAFSARKVIDEQSPLSSTQGRQLFSERLSLRCDPSHPAHLGASFDDFGAPGKPLVLVEKGTIRAFVYDANSAKQLNIPPTGHTVVTAGGLMEVPRYPVLEAEPAEPAQTFADVVKNTASGLLITRLLFVEPSSASAFSLRAQIAEGLVIADGKPVAWLPGGARLRLDLLMALATIDAWGPSQRVAGMVVPPLRIAGGFEIQTS